MECPKCRKDTPVVRDGQCPNCDYRDRERAKRELLFALQSRVLSDEEMKQVEAYDWYILVINGCSYEQMEVRALFSTMLLNQFRMRLAVKELPR